MNLWKVGLSLALLLILVGCPSVVSTGNLQVVITGLPSGVGANVVLTKPDKSTQTLTNSTKLEKVALGSYTVSAVAVSSGGVSYKGKVSGSPATVTANATATVTVTYAIDPASLGTLQVNVAGIPAGADAIINISGPAGFSQTLSTTTTLTGLVPGSYTVTANNLSSGGLTYAGTVSGSPAAVIANATATVSVTYAVSPSSLGTLQVNISGLPTGLSGSVSVSGPGGFSQNLTVTTTLNSLVPGAYTVTANNVPGAGATAGFTYKPTVAGSPAAVTAGASLTVGVAYAAITARLTVNIQGLPSGVNASVLVTKPGGFSQNLSATTTLGDLEPGTYTVTASRVRANGPIVDSIFEVVDPSSVEVAIAAGETGSATSSYVGRGGTGMLWIPVGIGANGGISGISAAQLAAATPTESTITPAGAISVSGGRAQQAAFDPSGNVYISTIFFDSIRKYTAAQLAAGGAQTPVKISDGGTQLSLNNPRGMAFDASGNLWGANGGDNSLRAFSSAQLDAGGQATPIKVITSTSLVTPIGLAFDFSGNLWVSNGGAKTLVRFTPAQLAAGGNVLPADVLQVQVDALVAAAGLAFDSAGNLWVADFSGNTILKFTPQQLSAGGAQTATVTLGGLDGPRGLALDNGGNLWVTQAFSTVMQIAAADLVTSGSPTPAKKLTGYGDNNIAALAFSPTPSNLPIQNK